MTEPTCQLAARISHPIRKIEALKMYPVGSRFLWINSISRNIIEILRSTLRRLEQDADFRQDDPAVVQLKRHILQSLAEFELQKASQPRLESRPGIELEKPISVLRIR